MTPTVTFSNPPPPATLPPLPGPGDVKLGWVPVTRSPEVLAGITYTAGTDRFFVAHLKGGGKELWMRKLPDGKWTKTVEPLPVTRTRLPIPEPKWRGGDMSKQHRQKGRTR